MSTVKNQDVWIVPAGGTDDYGDPLPSGDPVYARAHAVLPRKGRETDSGGVVVISGLEIFFKPRPAQEIIDALVATSAILVRGEEHQLDGPAADYGKAIQIFTTKGGV